MGTIKEGTLLLPPTCPQICHKAGEWAACGQTFLGRVQGSPFFKMPREDLGSAVRYLGSNPGSVFHLLWDAM